MAIQPYLAYDGLLIDELGYVEVEPVQVGLFFTLLQQRHRRKPTLITSNLGFNDWRSFLKKNSAYFGNSRRQQRWRLF